VLEFTFYLQFFHENKINMFHHPISSPYAISSMLLLLVGLHPMQPVKCAFDARAMCLVLIFLQQLASHCYLRSPA